jgi:hypothetical protein
MDEAEMAWIKAQGELDDVLEAIHNGADDRDGPQSPDAIRAFTAELRELAERHNCYLVYE